MVVISLRNPKYYIHEMNKKEFALSAGEAQERKQIYVMPAIVKTEGWFEEILTFLYLRCKINL